MKGTDWPLSAVVGNALGAVVWSIENPAIDPERPEAQAWQRVFGNLILRRLRESGWTIEPPDHSDGEAS